LFYLLKKRTIGDETGGGGKKTASSPRGRGESVCGAGENRVPRTEGRHSQGGGKNNCFLLQIHVIKRGCKKEMPIPIGKEEGKRR